MPRNYKSDAWLIRTDILKHARKAPCWSIAAPLFTSLYLECSWEAWQVEFAQVMGLVRADAEGELRPPHWLSQLALALNQPSSVPDDSMTAVSYDYGKNALIHFLSWPHLERDGVWPKYSTPVPETWTVEKGQQQQGECKGNTALNDTTNFSAESGF